MRRGEVRYSQSRELRKFVIRLWVDGHDLHYADHALGVAMDLAQEAVTPFDAAQVIADQIAHLNAVEVLDMEGNGSVIYPVWP